VVTDTFPSEKPYTRCLVEAAAWCAKLADEGIDRSPELDRWLSADDRHRAAWRQVRGPWTFIGEHANAPEILKLRGDVLRRAHASSRARSWVSRISIAATALLAVLGVLFWAFRGPTIYQTGLGERRVVALSDGSQVELDSASELRLRYSKDARELTLLRGQARFAVAHDESRPFSVVAGNQKVIATGTAFTVDLLDSTLYVTLLEGRVLVRPRNAVQGGAPTAELGVGEQLVVSTQGRAHVAPANLEQVMAWRQGKIIFDDEPLSTAIERVNRYSVNRLVLVDDRVAALRISGVFHISNISEFVDTLTHYLPLKSEKQHDTVLLSLRELTPTSR